MINDIIEQKIIDAGLTFPRISVNDIDKFIKSTDYYIFPNSTMTVCMITMTNDFSIIGESACASTENFNEEIGREIAYNNAKEKIWPLVGFLLREKLYNAKR